MMQVLNLNVLPFPGTARFTLTINDFVVDLSDCCNFQVMSAIESMWVLEEECGVLEQKFQGFVGCSWDELDIDNVDVDFIEDLMLRAKPMNDSLSDVRGRQMKKLAEVNTGESNHPKV